MRKQRGGGQKKRACGLILRGPHLAPRRVRLCRPEENIWGRFGGNTLSVIKEGEEKVSDTHGNQIPMRFTSGVVSPNIFVILI